MLPQKYVHYFTLLTTRCLTDFCLQVAYTLDIGSKVIIFNNPEVYGPHSKSYIIIDNFNQTNWINTIDELQSEYECWCEYFTPKNYVSLPINFRMQLHNQNYDILTFH